MAVVSDTLKVWRKRLGITQAQAATVLDVPIRTYQGWEAGRHFDRATILRFALEHVEQNAKKLL